jgi:hypothetical protein
MDFSKFVEWVFYGVLGGSAIYGVSILAHLKNSIDQLNQRMAQIVEKTQWHERTIDDHNERFKETEERLRALEIKRR